MRFLYKLPLLALSCLIAAEIVVPAASLAGVEPVTIPESGATGISDTLQNGSGRGRRNFPQTVNNDFSDVLQNIRTNQSVPSVNGQSLPVSRETFDTLVQALSAGRGNSGLGVTPGSSAPPATTLGTQPVLSANRPGGSIFGIRNGDLPAGPSQNNTSRPGGSVFGMRNSESSESSNRERATGPGGSIFGLRSSGSSNGHSGETAQQGLSNEALNSVAALERQLLAETGLTIDVDLISMSPGNYRKAVRSANRVVRQLNSAQLESVSNSPTFMALLKLLRDVETSNEETPTNAGTGGASYSLPWITLR